MVDIVVKDWCKLVDLFCKFFSIKCHDGQQGLLKFPRFAMLKLGGLPLTYKGVFKYFAGVFRWGWVFKAKMLTLLLLGSKVYIYYYSYYYGYVPGKMGQRVIDNYT